MLSEYAPKLPPYSVVVAEDNQVLRDLLVQQLADHGHTIAGVASTGIDVVELVGRLRPDVAVIDRGLPLQDGLAASRDIAAQSPTPVVVLSGYLSRDDPEEEAEEAGAQVFLAKPYTMEELEDALQYAVRRFSSKLNSLGASPKCG
ncbi:MAG: ANTAR domain-containing response regulator [Chloroflexota bacterium]